MKTQNNFKKELEKKQKGLFLIGLLASLSLTLMAFEWATFDVDYLAEKTDLKDEIIEIEIPIEVEMEKPKPKKIIQTVVEFDPLVNDTFITKDYDTAIAMNPITDTAVDDPIIPIDDPIDGGSGPVGLDDEPFTVVEKMPQFPGGEAKLYAYLSKHISHTNCSSQSRLRGTLYAQFVVEKDGSITNVLIPRGLGCGLDEMVTKVVKKMPDWEPGEQRGKPVRVKYTLPVKFE